MITNCSIEAPSMWQSAPISHTLTWTAAQPLPEFQKGSSDTSRRHCLVLLTSPCIVSVAKRRAMLSLQTHTTLKQQHGCEEKALTSD